MLEVSMIGIDLSKSSFQLHGARADGSVAFRKTLSRAGCLVFWRGSLAALSRWRRAGGRITGAGRSASWATRFGWFRRSM